MVYIPVSTSPKEIKEYIKGFAHWVEKVRDRKLQQLQDSARQSPYLYEYLAYRYKGLNILKHNGIKFPLIIFQAPASQRGNIESVLGDLDQDLPEVLYTNIEQSGQAFLKKLTKRQKPPWDDPTYRMVKFFSENELKFKCGLGSYYSMLKTCDILELELLTEFGKNNPRIETDFVEFSRRLKLREYVHSLGNPFMEQLGRSVAISISTLVIFLENNAYKVLVRERSKDVAVHGNLLHILPSFMFQPLGRWYTKEYSVRHNIYREYLEEVLGRKDVERLASQTRYDFFYEDPNLKYLEQLERQGKSKFVFTGVSFNLLNLRPEIHTLLLITDPDWIVYQGRGASIGALKLDVMNINWEFKKQYESEKAQWKGIGTIDLGRDLEIPGKLFRPENFVPPGAAGLKLGVDVAREELGLT